MPLRAVAAVALASVSASTVVAKSCGDALSCAADFGDSPSLLQRRAAEEDAPAPEAPPEGGRTGFLTGAGDDEDPAAELIGLALKWKQHPKWVAPPEVEEPPECFGEVWITSSKGLSDSTNSQRLCWNLVDVDFRCKAGPQDVENSCAMRMERGNRCEEQDSDSFYSPSDRLLDPWRFTTYTAFVGEASVTTKMSIRAETGLSAKDVRSSKATIVAYDFYGKPMACAPIDTKVNSRPLKSQQRMAPPLPDAMIQRSSPHVALPQQSGLGSALRAWQFTRYPGYTGPLNVWGRVLVYEIAGESIALMGHYMKWDFEDVDVLCAQGPGENPHSCGVRITTSDSCDKPNEAPYYNKDEVLQDPWPYVSYTAVQAPHVVLAQNMGIPVLTGHDSPDIIEQTLLVYDFHGKPVACAIVDIAG